MSIQVQYYLYTDGACKGNPGKSSVGVVLYDANMTEIATISKKIGLGTNNEAEYKALLEGLELCKEYNISLDKVIIRMDSLLVVNQILGKFKVHNERLHNLFTKVKSYGPLTIEHVYRTNNKRADELANNAMK